MEIEKLETFIRYALHLCTFVTDEDEEPDLVEQVDEEFPLSRTLFPSVVRAIKTGSRAEKTYIDKAADTDTIYEIGPGTVSEKLSEESSKKRFYWSKTSNPGYYRIEDEWGDYLYPKVIQIKVGSLLMVGKTQYTAKSENPVASEREITGHGITVKYSGETKAALTDGNEDQVLAIRLDAWPKEIWVKMQSKLGWCEHLKEKIKGKSTVFCSTFFSLLNCYFLLPQFSSYNKEPKWTYEIHFLYKQRNLYWTGITVTVI